MKRKISGQELEVIIQSLFIHPPCNLDLGCLEYQWKKLEKRIRTWEKHKTKLPD